jgi:hypothetical protein
MDRIKGGEGKPSPPFFIYLFELRLGHLFLLCLMSRDKNHKKYFENYVIEKPGGG